MLSAGSTRWFNPLPLALLEVGEESAELQPPAAPHLPNTGEEYKEEENGEGAAIQIHPGAPHLFTSHLQRFLAPWCLRRWPFFSLVSLACHQSEGEIQEVQLRQGPAADLLKKTPV